MNRFQTLVLALSLTCSFNALAQVATPVAADAVVLSSGDFTLSKTEYERLVLGFERAAGAVTSGANAQSTQSGQEVARLLALVTEAQRRKLDQTPEMQALIKVRSYVILSGALMKSLTEEVKKDEAGTRALWESDKSNYFDVVARQILIRYQGAAVEGANNSGIGRTEEQAKALAKAAYQKIKAGADFAALAKTASDDQNTRNQGGLMPAFTRGAMVGEFESAAFTTPVSGVSEPFKTKYGYHVVKVDERKPFAFERVRSTLEFTRAKQKLEAIASSGIQLNEAYFKR
jgi:parvulin-like peptidyl-prolyl isomerase